MFAARNYDLENGDWEASIIWDENKPFTPFSQIRLNMNDTNVLFDITSIENKGTSSLPTIVCWLDLFVASH